MPTTRLWDQQTLQPFKGRFLLAALYFVVLLSVGTSGYVTIEGWPFMDALYMAAITASAVGYGEVEPLTQAGRIFTIGLMGASVVGLGIWWALTTALLVEADLGGMLRRRRTMRKLENLSNHFIVCGAGRMGRVIIEELRHADVPFAVIEADPDRVSRLTAANSSMLIVEEDATKEQSLEQAGIARARGIAACLADDADNLLLCMTARGLRKEINIVSRAYNHESIDKMRRAGATHSVSPNVTGAVRMASALLRPSVVGFLDAATLGSAIDLRLEDAVIPEASRLVGKTLADAKIPQETGLIVLALRRHDEPLGWHYNPGPETRLEGGDIMIALGSAEQVQKLRNYAARGELEV